MLHPVGSQSPSVYWRRRLLMAASLIVLLILIVLTFGALSSGGGGKPSGQAGQSVGLSSGPSTPAPTTSRPTTTPSPTTTPTTGKQRTGTGSPTVSTPPTKCLATQLKVQAVVAKSEYRVGDEPVLTLQVTNSGPAPCVQDVADPQIVLRVYNGASRVWGSHDCQTTPGVTDKTLPVGRPIGFSLTWSGLTAQPGCA
ncbi:MAG: hypothetical protein ABI429_05820, partial [Jatrophihabitantaceae bacterium]